MIQNAVRENSENWALSKMTIVQVVTIVIVIRDGKMKNALAKPWQSPGKALAKPWQSPSEKLTNKKASLIYTN